MLDAAFSEAKKIGRSSFKFHRTYHIQQSLWSLASDISKKYDIRIANALRAFIQYSESHLNDLNDLKIISQGLRTIGFNPQEYRTFLKYAKKHLSIYIQDPELIKSILHEVRKLSKEYYRLTSLNVNYFKKETIACAIFMIAFNRCEMIYSQLRLLHYFNVTHSSISKIVLKINRGKLKTENSFPSFFKTITHNLFPDIASNKKTAEEGITIAETIMNIHPSANAAGVTAGIIYFLSRKYGLSLTQDIIATRIKQFQSVTEATLRHWYVFIRENVEGSPILTINQKGG